MKKHAIIPIFIPFRGCRNKCVFCNQSTITARTDTAGPGDVRRITDSYLETLRGRGLDTIEIAFFGGSFTGIPIEEQSALLEAAYEYKKAGLVDKIHMSTRPDYIDERILDNLAKYGADIIELGVQSFDDEVLLASKRGHTSEDVFRACRLIREYGFTLGIQLMIGLPKDSREKSVESARITASLAPALARIYPTVVLSGTELADMMENGAYQKISEEEMVDTASKMYRILSDAGITIMRVGLKSTDLVTEGADLSRNYHPAFRQLVEGKIALEDIEEILERDFPPGPGALEAGRGSTKRRIALYSNQHSFSAMIGHKAVNRKTLEKERPDIEFVWKKDESLSDNEYRAKALSEHEPGRK